MKSSFGEKLKIETTSSRALLIIAELAIGLSYALATILGVIGAQRQTTPNLPIPNGIVSGLFIGTAIWVALTGLSIQAIDKNRIPSSISRIPLGWILISFITCTVIPLIYFSQQNGGRIAVLWIQFIQICLFSALSFGVGGVIIGMTAILIHFFFSRLLASLKWGIIVTCAIGFLLGLSAGWAAYGWTVFSSQALFSLDRFF